MTSNDPLEQALDELIRIAREAGEEFILKGEWGTGGVGLRAVEKQLAEQRKYILETCRWVGECACFLPEMHCPVCAPDLYNFSDEDYKEEYENKKRVMFGRD